MEKRQGRWTHCSIQIQMDSGGDWKLTERPLEAVCESTNLWHLSELSNKRLNFESDKKQTLLLHLTKDKKLLQKGFKLVKKKKKEYINIFYQITSYYCYLIRNTTTKPNKNDKEA